MAIYMSQSEYRMLLDKNTTLTAEEENKEAKSKSSHLRSRNIGKHFEDLIEKGCQWYEDNGIACIRKCPEPFSVCKKTKDGMFVGRFTGAKAQPDFQGTILGGLSFNAEAKATEKDKLLQSAVTETQAKLLDSHERAGALCYILGQIKDRNFIIPWDIWKDMKNQFGRKYVKPEDIERYEIIWQNDGNSLPFLQNIIH